MTVPAAMVPPGARPRPRAPAPWVPRAGWGTGRGRRRPPGRWRAASTGLPASFPSVPLPPGVTDVSGNGSAQPGRRPRGTGNVCRGATCSDRQPGRAAASGLRRGGLLRQPRRVGPCPSPASHGLATGRCSPRLGPPVTVHGPGRRAWGLQPSERRTRCKTEAQPGGPAGRMAWAPRKELWGAGPPGSRATRTRPPPSPLPSSEGAEHWEGSRGQAPAASWEHEPSPLSGLLPASPLKYAGAQGIASLEGSHFCKTEEVVAQLKTRPLRAFSKPVPMRAWLVRAGWGSQGSPRGTASPVMSRDWATSLAISCQRAG